MKKKLLISSIGVLVLAGSGFLLFKNLKSGDKPATPTIKVVQGTVVDKVLAIGTIEPENEISIKSKVSGMVKRLFVEVGSYVRAGQPLIEVKPDPTPLELAEATRGVELAESEVENLTKERARQEALVAKQLISTKEYDDFQHKFEDARLRLNIAKEKLALLKSGKVMIENTEIESIIRAPIDGFLLTKTVEVGDPVTPLTSYQEGTVLMKMANMSRLLFKGTVDETDVGKLKEGMEVELKVGALPNAKIKGTLSKIWLKSEKKENSTVFPVEITILKTNSITLRAGYSANANIIIQRKDNVLIIPERMVTFRNDSTFVKIPLPQGKSEERVIKTGLSDAINIEVVAGLKEGDDVLEKPVKKIE